MKRFLTWIVIMLLSASMVIAQAPVSQIASQKGKTTKAAVAPVKKDGTPDKRYKVNKTTAKGPVKKDGTADMRYKANKGAVKKKS